MVNIKRELWKDKYVIVARDKGRIRAWAKWSQKFNVNSAKALYKSNMSFKKDIVRVKLKNVYEVTDYNKAKPDRRTSMRYQYFVETRIRNKTIAARSLQYDLSYPKKKAREEALEGLYGRIHGAVEGIDMTGDEEEGEKIFKASDEARNNLKEAVVYYTAAA